MSPQKGQSSARSLKPSNKDSQRTTSLIEIPPVLPFSRTPAPSPPFCQTRKRSREQLYNGYFTGLRCCRGTGWDDRSRVSNVCRSSSSLQVNITSLPLLSRPPSYPRSVQHARPRVFIDLGKPPPDPPKHFPAESQEGICRANFTVTGFDRHDVPTVISRRETLMAAPRLAGCHRRNDNLSKDPSSPSRTGLYSEFVLSNFHRVPCTPYGSQATYPLRPSLQRYYFFHGRASAICSAARTETVK